MNVSSPTSSAERLFWPALGLILACGLGLRLAHSESVWTYWTLDYLSYYGPIRDDLATGSFPWTRLVGLHPPQHALGVSGLLAAGGSVASVIRLSVALSLGASALAGLTLRQLGAPSGGLLAAAALAISPYQVHYGVELNNYPLFLFGGAALIWAASRLMTLPAADGMAANSAGACPTPPRHLFVLGGAALLTLHGHAAGLPLVGTLGVLFVLARRTRAALTLGAALILFAPIGVAMLAMLEGKATFHNATLEWSELPLELRRAWIGRFGPVWGLAAAATLVPLGLVHAALGHNRGRLRAGPVPGAESPCRWALVGGLLLLVAIATVLAGMRSGAAHAGQTPYWLFASWLGWTLVGLGWSAAGLRGRGMLGLVLGIWLASVGLGLAGGSSPSLSGAATSPTVSAHSAQALRQHLEIETSPGDAVVYLWEPLFLNDSPLGRDPLFSAFSPSELGDWLGNSAPCRNSLFRWMQRSLCVRSAAGMRGGEHEEMLAEDLQAWLRAGVTVHLIQAGLDPKKPRPNPDGLKARVTAQHHSAEISWDESRPGGIRVLRVASDTKKSSQGP